MALERLEASSGLEVSLNLLASSSWSVALVALDRRQSSALRGLQVVVVAIVAMSTTLGGAQKLSMAFPVSCSPVSKKISSCVVHLLDLRQRCHGTMQEQLPRSPAVAALVLKASMSFGFESLT